MISRERVIEILENHKREECCPEDHEAFSMAIDLLSSKAPVRANCVRPTWLCATCGGEVATQTIQGDMWLEKMRFCPWCGRGIDWDA